MCELEWRILTQVGSGGSGKEERGESGVSEDKDPPTSQTQTPWDPQKWLRGHPATARVGGGPQLGAKLAFWPLIRMLLLRGEDKRGPGCPPAPPAPAARGKLSSLHPRRPLAPGGGGGLAVVAAATPVRPTSWLPLCCTWAAGGSEQIQAGGGHGAWTVATQLGQQRPALGTLRAGAGVPGAGVCGGDAASLIPQPRPAWDLTCPCPCPPLVGA